MRLAATLPLLLCALVTPSVSAQGPLDMSEILLLLRLGVPSDAVHAALEARGGPQAIVEEDLARARALRPGPDLERWLESRSKTVQKLGRLAKEFKVHHVGEAGLDLLVERTWEVEATPLPNGTFLTITPQLRSAGTWFSTPTILCWMTRATAFPAEAEGELAEKVSQLFLRRLRGYGLKLEERHREKGMIGDRMVPQLRLVGEEPVRRYRGTIGLRTRILTGGTVVSLAFAAGVGDLPRTEAVFEEIARSVTLASEPLVRRKGR